VKSIKIVQINLHIGSTAAEIYNVVSSADTAYVLEAFHSAK